MSDAPGTYTINYDPWALKVKELGKLDKGIARRIVRTIDDLARDPRPSASRADQVAELRWRADDGVPKAALARELGVSRETPY